MYSLQKDDKRPGTPARDNFVLIAAWLAVSSVLAVLALRIVSVPGLYYDEAVFAGLAQDFLHGNAHGLHMPGTEAVQLFGRPFPLFVQSYLGAVKAWLIMPGFLLFGPSIAVLRLTSLFWCLVILLFFMLWTRRWLGLAAAVAAAPIVGLDPSFFFISVLDWGSSIPSFLCRVCGYYFIHLWWHGKGLRHGFLAGFMLGLGFYNKIDFAVILIGCGIAACTVYGKEMRASARDFPAGYAVLGAGFFLGSGLMAGKIGIILQSLLAGRISGNEHEMLEKYNTTLAMYDGSYMCRLMQAGGRFDAMYAGPASVWSPFGVIVVCSGLFLVFTVVRRKGELSARRATGFMLLSLVLVTAGAFLLPGAVRLHHAMLVYPFPHLLVVAAITLLWRAAPPSPVSVWSIRGCAAGLAVVVVAGHLLAISKTEDLMETTGGRGYWSNAMESFCNDVKGQTGLTVVSLDWGFNEQLSFLGRGVQLAEPFWDNRNITIAPDTIYLVHLPDFSIFPQGVEFFIMASRLPPRDVTITPYRDRQGNVAFYALRFPRGKAGL